MSYELLAEPRGVIRGCRLALTTNSKQRIWNLAWELFHEWMFTKTSFINCSNAILCHTYKNKENSFGLYIWNRMERKCFRRLKSKPFINTIALKFILQNALLYTRRNEWPSVVIEPILDQWQFARLSLYYDTHSWQGVINAQIQV